MFKIVIRCFLILMLSTSVAYAVGDLGEVAGNALQPVGFLADFLYKVCYVLGIAFFAGALIQYKAHRENPSQVRLNQPIWLLIMALILGGLPWFVQLSSSSETIPQPQTQAQQ